MSRRDRFILLFIALAGLCATSLAAPAQAEPPLPVQVAGAAKEDAADEQPADAAEQPGETDAQPGDAAQQPAEPAPAPAGAGAPPTKGFQLGDAAITGFSGTALAGDSIKPGVDPVDKTVINLDGPSLRVFDATHLGPQSAGKVLPPTLRFEVPARDVGQVFALAFEQQADGTANLYAGATSLYGLQIVGGAPDADGKPVRLKAGAAGAKFMDGQLGPQASPGTIWKIDGATGKASLFADTSDGGAVNSGPGLGDLAVDGASRSLYVSDLDTGLIHRIGLDGPPKPSASFDHGTAGRAAAKLAEVADDGKHADIESAEFKPDDPATWGTTQDERRIDGLAVQAGRLFYAVAAGPEIWSVGLNADGSFNADPRLELVVKAEQPALVTDIVFDQQGRMILALRGATKNPFDYRTFVDAGSGDVLRFAPIKDSSGEQAAGWEPDPESYGVGVSTGNRGGTGGAALGFAIDENGNADVALCSGTLGLTGDVLAAQPEGSAHGLQLSGIDAVRPADTPAQSAMLEYDQLQNDKEFRGHVGDVEILQRCDGAGAGPAVAQGGAPGASGEPGPAGGAAASGPPNLTVNKQQNCQLAGETSLSCDFTINATNTGATPVDPAGVVVEDVFSVAPASIELPEGAEQTATGFRLAGGATDLKFKATFDVPQGGLVVENCASLAPPQQTPAGDPGLPSDEADGATVEVTGGPVCEPEGEQQNCKFNLTFRNDGDKLAKADFMLRLSEDIVSVGGPSNSGNDAIDPKTIAVTAGSVDPGQQRDDLEFNISIPKDAPPPTATVALGADPARFDELAAANPKDDQPFIDGDPDDNTSCIRFDTNNPTDQGTPTPAPTEPQPGDVAQETPQDQQTGPLTIEKIKSTLACSVDGGCSFQIGVTNIGEEPFTGPIAIDEQITIDGAVANGAEIDGAPDAPFTCSKSGAGFTCEAAPGTVLEKGATLPLSISFKPGAGAEAAKEFKNCATVQGTANSACDTIPLGPPPAQPENKPQLSVSKTVAAEGCKKLPGSGWICAFDVTITNESDVDFTGPVVLNDRMQFNTKVNLGGPASNKLVCSQTKALAHGCSAETFTLKAKTTSEPAKLVVVLADVDVPEDIEAKDCKLVNTITLTEPPGAGGQQSTSEATVLLPPGENKGQRIRCDPPALKLEKTAQGCVPAGDGFDCRFKITVTSVGPDPFQGGDIAINEKLPDGATVKTSSGNWSCTGGGGATLCSQKNVHLAVGATLDLDMTIAVPKSSVGRGSCEIKNDASIVQPAPDRAGSRSTLSASATAKIDSEECKPKCQGELKLRNGECSCGEGLTARNGRCVSTPTASCLAFGYVGKYPYCRPNVPTLVSKVDPEKCYPGMKLVAGECRCTDGKSVRNGRCSYPPKPETHGNETTTVYRPPVEEPPVIDEPAYSETTRPCPRGMLGEPPSCYCPDGMRYSRYRGCVANVATAEDPPVGRPCPGHMVGIRPYCSCRVGYRKTGRYTCVPEGAGPVVDAGPCPSPLIGRRPNCYCPAGLRRVGARMCVPDNKPGGGGGGVDRPCPDGMQGRWPYCHCAPGMRRVGARRCVPDNTAGGGGVGRPCPSPMYGTMPRCSCPAAMKRIGAFRCGPGGTAGTGGWQGGKPTACKGNLVGYEPSCSCPAGMKRVGRNRCAPAGVAGGGRCSGQLIGTPPNCYCPPGTQRYGLNVCRRGPTQTGPDGNANANNLRDLRRQQYLERIRERRKAQYEKAAREQQKNNHSQRWRQRMQDHQLRQQQNQQMHNRRQMYQQRLQHMQRMQHHQQMQRRQQMYQQRNQQMQRHQYMQRRIQMYRQRNRGPVVH